MQNNKKDQSSWQQALIMFARVSVWVAVPIILALFIGKYLDNHFGTAPWIFIGSTIIAFIISMAVIVKMSLSYIQKIEGKDNQENKKEENGKSN
ncbi:MAG: AtpZ/AtpI family protein [Patescibacteria group bacterium]|nr:AtpZ/AtpI family protein [Patescibacteria group bacterium]